MGSIVNSVNEFGSVDPGGAGKCRGFGMIPDKTFRSTGVGRGQGGGLCPADVGGVAMVDIKGGVHRNPGMPVGQAIPTDEADAERPGIL